MKLMFAEQMLQIDKYAIETLGIPGIDLMANAAEHIASASLEHLPMGATAAIFCGVGNNGGDGIGAAVNLIDKGVPVRVVLIGDIDKLTHDSNKMRERLTELGGHIESISEIINNGELDDLVDYVAGCDVVIDAIFGIGLNAEITGDALLATRIINEAGSYVIAADIPSGVHANTGRVLGNALNADLTITFSSAKPGHYIEPGCTHCGEIRVCDIGIPDELLSKNSEIDAYIETLSNAKVTDTGANYDTELLSSDINAVMMDDIMLPIRRPDSHKGDYGRLLIAAGSVGYTGAPALCARAASRMGAGLVFLGVPDVIYQILAGKLDEEMPFPLPSGDAGKLSASAISEFLRRAGECDAVLLGPGLGRSSDLSEFISTAIDEIDAPIILDADGINAVADNFGNLSVKRFERSNQSRAIIQAELSSDDNMQNSHNQSRPLIITPHLGEFARLGGDVSGVDRLGAARGFAMRYKCILVLKGHRTISAFPDGAAYINTTGGPAMAKGGSGDVLAGMIAALVCQKFSIKDAVCTAVFLHGFAGDMCAAAFGEYSVVAGDIISMIPKAILSLQHND